MTHYAFAEVLYKFVPSAATIPPSRPSAAHLPLHKGGFSARELSNKLQLELHISSPIQA